MLLMKRSRSPKKDRQTSRSNLTNDPISEPYVRSNVSNQKSKSRSFLNVPGLFVGFNPLYVDSYSVRSPTSPLDFRIFSSFGNPFRCPKSLNVERKKSWDGSKVGLSIIDSLEDAWEPSEKLSPIPSANKNIVFGPKMSVRDSNFASRLGSVLASKSLPKHIPAFSIARSNPFTAQNNPCGVVFELGDGNLRAHSLDSGERGSHFTDLPYRKSRFGSPNLAPENIPTKPITSEPLKLSSSPTSTNHRSVDSIEASDIENSEDYTRVITRGPNPKVTHIFAGCVLECKGDDLTEFVKKNEGGAASYNNPDDFLKFCYSCQKKLDGKDIYMYRGEKAFCSDSCRLEVIEIDEEMDKLNGFCPTATSETSKDSKSCGEVSTSESGLFVIT